MVPEGWTVETVDSLCQFVSVGIVVKPAQYYVEAAVGGVRAFRSANVREGRINDSDWVYLSQEGHLNNSKSILKAGDVLIVRSGYPGTACVVTEQYDGSNCIDTIFARPDKTRILPEYLCAFTNSEPGRKQVFGTQGGLAQKHLNVAAYKKLRLLVPPIREQERIVEVLARWDKAMEVIDKLIRNSVKQKQALTQALIWGTKRLGRFSAGQETQSTTYGMIPKEWRFARIGEIADEVSIRNTGGNNLTVLACSKHAGFVKSLEYFKKKVYSDDTSTYKVAPRGTFGFPSNHIEEGSIGYQDICDAGLVSPIYCLFRTTGSVSDDYLFRLFKTDHYRQIFSAATSSSVDRRGSLRWREFAKLHVPLPSIEEQQMISQVLKVADAATANLASQFENLRAQRSALTQLLLTGKRRIKVQNVGDTVMAIG
jgi:restriction endonuclease S subunit